MAASSAPQKALLEVEKDRQLPRRKSPGGAVSPDIPRVWKLLNYAHDSKVQEMMSKSHLLFLGSTSSLRMLESALAQPELVQQEAMLGPSQALRQPWGHSGIPNRSQM